MSSDRELLEFAAKAAGLPWSQWVIDGDDSWNPLTDDGDALRLAASLQADVMLPNDDTGDERGPCASVIFPLAGDYDMLSEWVKDHAGDRMAATRRAIVRAAAEIARATSDTGSHTVSVEKHETFQQPSPTCQHCGHALDTDEMLYGKPTCEEDLFALAPNEGRCVIECPRCDLEYWVQGGYKPHYTSTFAEEEL